MCFLKVVIQREGPKGTGLIGTAIEVHPATYLYAWGANYLVIMF